ncbi:MFS transporter [Streptomyces sp. MST-110588]|uniref:MFS transporter n=1 Tax=Streptomyces sp. MST-110588 TaxID=2833628 RepID=UPI001F5C8E4C|nr:MFS transporter [Streptomyces sp. MST-110588]UNO40266.1 hypothetical protein KGS77_12615 [Streptomyces sp. MST-110588]
MRWPHGVPKAPGPWRPRRPGVPRAVRHDFTTAAVTTVFAWSLLGVFLALVPSVAAALNHTAGTAVGGGIVALMLVCSALAQSCATRLAPGAGQLAGLGVMPAGLALLVLASGTRSLPLLAVAAVVSGAGQGIGFTGALTDLSAVLPAQARGEVLSVAYAVGYLALAVPVLGIGALADRTGVLPAVTWFGALAAPGCLITLAWFHRSRIRTTAVRRHSAGRKEQRPVLPAPTAPLTPSHTAPATAPPPTDDKGDAAAPP